MFNLLHVIGSRNLFAWLTIVPLTLASSLFAQSFLPTYQKGSATFERDIVIGGDIDDTDYFLLSPTDIAVDSNGNLFILDYKGYCIKKFDKDGKHLKTIGRQGEGPGEMLGAYRMAIDPDDNVAIYDPQNSRISFFANDGEFLKSFDLSEIGWRTITEFAFAPDGKLYAALDTNAFSKPNSKTLTSISRFTLDPFAETVVDSVYIQKWYMAQSGDAMMSISAPFYPELMFGIAPSGDIVVANSDDYTMKIYSPELTLKTESKYRTEKPKVTEEDKEDYLSDWDEEDAKIIARKNARFPKHKPYFANLIIDHEGYILFELNNGGAEEKMTTYDVFTPGGEFVNKVTLPSLRSTAILANGVVYNIERPEDGDPTVQRYRVK